MEQTRDLQSKRDNLARELKLKEILKTKVPIRGKALKNFTQKVTDFVGAENRQKILIFLYRDDISFTERDCLKYFIMKRPVRKGYVDSIQLQRECVQQIAHIQKNLSLSKKFHYLYTLSGKIVLDLGKLAEDCYTVVVSNRTAFAGLGRGQGRPLPGLEDIESYIRLKNRQNKQLRKAAKVADRPKNSMSGQSRSLAKINVQDKYAMAFVTIKRLEKPLREADSVWK